MVNGPPLPESLWNLIPPQAREPISKLCSEKDARIAELVAILAAHDRLTSKSQLGRPLTESVAYASSWPCIANATADSPASPLITTTTYQYDGTGRVVSRWNSGSRSDSSDIVEDQSTDISTCRDENGNENLSPDSPDEPLIAGSLRE